MKRKSSGIKHLEIYNEVSQKILSGQYGPGDQLPTEHELSDIFSASRPTVNRAMRDLQQQGLIVRQKGKGSFVTDRTRPENMNFGMLVHWQLDNANPATMSTIFGSILPEMSRIASKFGYSLLLNNTPTTNTNAVERAKLICKELIKSDISGVFFTPLEVPTELSHINCEIAEELKRHNKQVILLDRDIQDSYHRSDFDIIGINNEQSSLILTNHLIELGCTKIDFIAAEKETTAIKDRIRGYKAALEEHNIVPEESRMHFLDTKELLSKGPGWDKAKAFLDSIKNGSVEAFVCVNDITAADMMNFLIRQDIKIPQQIRIVGFDDLPIIDYLPIPLTTIRQPVATIAYEAIRTMVDRLQNPDMDARDIMVKTELVIRESCGAHLRVKTSPQEN